MRKWLVGLGVVVVAALGVGLLLPNRVTVTRRTTILAPAETVFTLVATPRRWPMWSPWNARDPQMAITYSGPESGEGATWSWKSASEGDGSMVMTRATAPSDLAFELTIAGMGPPSRGAFAIRSSGSGSEVEWTMTTEMGLGPVGGWFALAFRPRLERDFERGLASLKRRAEALAPTTASRSEEAPAVPSPPDPK